MPRLSAKQPGHRAGVPNSMCEIGRGWEVADIGLQQEAYKMWGLADVMEMDSLTCIKIEQGQADGMKTLLPIL